jgi:hypothetical protein
MLISSVVEVVAELKPKGYHHPQSIATASARRRKERHSDDTARRPRVWLVGHRADKLTGLCTCLAGQTRVSTVRAGRSRIPSDSDNSS